MTVFEQRCSCGDVIRTNDVGEFLARCARHDATCPGGDE